MTNRSMLNLKSVVTIA